MTSSFSWTTLEASLAESLVFTERSPFKFDRFRSHRLLGTSFLILSWGVCSALKSPTRCLSEHLLDIRATLIFAIVVTKLICQVALASFSIDVLVDTCGRSVRKQRLIIQIVVFIISKALSQSSCLVEQTLIKHDIFRSGLGLTQSNLLRDVSISVTLVFSLVETCLLSTSSPLILLSEQSPDFVSLLLLSLFTLIICIFATSFLTDHRQLTLTDIIGILATFTDFRVQFRETTCHKTFFFSSCKCSCLLDFLLTFHGLGYLDRMLNLISFFGLFPGLTFSSVEYICHLGVSRIDSRLLEWAPIRLQTHMQRDSISVSILPIRDAGWNIAVFHILSCEFARRWPHYNRRCLFWGSSGDFFMFVLRRFQGVLDNIWDLYDSLNSRICVRSWRIADKTVFINFFKSCWAKESRIAFLIAFDAKLLASELKILCSLFLRRAT